MLTFKRTNTVFFACLLTINLFRIFSHASGWWYVALGVAYMLVINIGSFRVNSNFHFKVFCNNPEIKDKVMLSFDDGPNADVTPRLLDVLKKHQVHAAFFLIGKKAEAHPELVQRIHQEGHIIANHTYGHSHYFDFFPGFVMKKEFMQSQELIYSLIGKRIHWFRPPYGVTNPMMKNALKKSGFLPVGWSVRSLDTVIKNPDRILARISAVKGGDIILLHDLRNDMPEIAERVLQLIHKKGLSVGEPEEIIGMPAYVETQEDIISKAS